MKQPIKKGFFSLLFFVLLVLFTACNPGSDVKPQSKTFISESPEMTTEMVYTYEGDKVTHQKTTNTMPYSSLGVTTQEEAKAILDPIVEQYQGYEGLTETIDYQEYQFIEVVEVDYLVVDIEAIRNIPGMTFEGDVSNGISLKRSEEMLLENGFIEKE